MSKILKKYTTAGNSSVQEQLTLTQTVLTNSISMPTKRKCDIYLYEMKLPNQR